MDDIHQETTTPGLWRGVLCAGSVSAVLASGVLALYSGWPAGVMTMALSVLPLGVALLAVAPDPMADDA